MKRFLIFLVLVCGADRHTNISKVYDNTVESVVEIRLGDKTRGAGVAVKKFVIATASHVVKDKTTVKVHLYNGKIVDGDVFFNDPDYDLALIRIKIEQKPVKLCLNPIIGEVAIAIGHPFKHKNTVTTGIVSGVNCEIEMPLGEKLTDMIQTSACVNPGNSGGPLFNINGELLGIVNVTQFNGVGFAVNANNVKKALTVD